MRVVMFATNSARRPSALPACNGPHNRPVAVRAPLAPPSRACQQISISYAKAPMPVMSRPTISVCMVSVPSKVWIASRSAMCRITW